jgi:hypothetical protein
MEVYDNFWIKLVDYWQYCYNRILSNDDNIKYIILKKINSFLDKKTLDISFTYGEINNIPLLEYNDIVELYISPILNKDNIEDMNRLYNTYQKYKNHLPNIIISKYRIFNKNNIKIKYLDYTKIYLSSANSNNINYPIITYDNQEQENDKSQEDKIDKNKINNKLDKIDEIDETKSEENIKETKSEETKYIINSTDIFYTTTIGKGNDHNILLHLVILFKKEINKFFEKKKIVFENSEREVWICNNNSIDIILENFIGEENLINYIGYIEFIPYDERSKKIEYKYINELINDIELVRNHNNIIYCNLCNHNSNQLKLSKCSRCQKVYYCNKICQKIDFPNHKLVCSISHN